LVAALARVIAEVDLLAKGLTGAVLPLSKAIEREVESMKMPPLVVCLTAIRTTNAIIAISSMITTELRTAGFLEANWGCIGDGARPL
jgi:hypothetical protein